MKISFLGTNGWYDTKTGNTTCTLLKTRNYNIVLDAGNGIYKLDQYIKNKNPVYLFLSHFHVDHISGLHILNKFNFKQGINIYGPPGTKDALNRIINKPYTVPFAKLEFKVKVHELTEGLHKIPFTLISKPLIHSTTCFGYRFELNNKIIAYCTDTGICENAIELAKNADILITECSFKIGQSNPEWPHLNPEDAAQIAKEANAKKLVMTHFDANNYKTLKERELAETHAKKIFRNSYAAFDNRDVVI